MNSPILRCPCGASLRPNGRYCTACGLEVRHRCPICGDQAPPEFFWLSLLEKEPDAWCRNKGVVLYACIRCGRRLPPGGRCPDPACAGRLLPVHPQHTGRRWDGTGGSVRWIWPPQWDRTDPRYSAPVVHEYLSLEPVHAAAIAHNRLYLWSGANFIAAPLDSGWVQDGDSQAATPAQDPIDWRVALGLAARPAGLSFESRIAISGGAAVLATERGFVTAPLWRPSETAPLEGGLPLAQAGGPDWWVGWSRDGGRPLLRTARAGHTDQLHLETIVAPEAAELAPGGSIVLRDDMAYWPGSDGGVWGLDCATRTLASALTPGPGVLSAWAVANGVCAAREHRGQVYLSLVVAGQGAVDPAAGSGPLRGVFATRRYVAAVGETIVAVDTVTGYRLPDARLPPGRWVTGTLVEAPDGEPRLLALTHEESAGRLSVYRLSSGAETLLWHRPETRPQSLLSVADALYVVHREGVTRLTVAPV